MTKSTVLPENVLRCLSAKDRAALGQKTAAEVMAAGEAKSERELQKSIVSLLRLKGIEPIVSRMDKRTSNNVGTPDILFSVMYGKTGWSLACAFEVKMPGRRLSPDQVAMATRMTKAPNHWRHRVITSVDMAIRELKEMGIT